MAGSIRLLTALLLLVAFADDVAPQVEECTIAEECITDLQQKDCTAGHFLKQNSAVGGCCPMCEEIAKPPRNCVNGLPGFECPLGMFCDSNLCKVNTTNCYHSLQLQGEGKIVYLPNCNADGSWQPVQCKGDSVIGRCFCVDEVGKRIFGMAWANKADDMTCACSRKRATLERAGRNDVTLHCASNGNYERLQCESRMCWCANAKTGEPESPVLIDDLVSQLPCYDSNTFGSQYMRVCESKANAIAQMKNLLALHGTTTVTMESVNCDYDGTYGVYQIENGIAYCAWKDGKRLGSWQTVADGSLKYVNCNCARDTKYYQEVGKVMTQLCSGNGNYKPDQHLNGQAYCVDGDGYPTTPLQEDGEEDLKCFG